MVEKINKQDALTLAKHLKDIGLVSSTTEGLRMIKQGAVSYYIESIVYRVGKRVKRVEYKE